MHLKTLRLRGFKSFAEPVELHFEPGVSVIVGPNGSGKSNVADGLQWAMASLSPTELRTQVAADVLFGGSVRRQASGFAEVEMVLDNEDGRFGSGRPEVSVMRRLRRDADTEYLLNRVPVRRLDVQEALADAGLGRELHAIVSQGRVDEILLSRPDDRRGFIEEAAGLGKYKRRRHRAAGKLARVEGNLARARDLEGELKAALRPLALQATAAERAALLVAEIDAARIELGSSQIASARRQRARIAADLERVTGEQAAVDQALAASSAARAAAERELAALVSGRERASERFWALAGAGDRLGARRERLVEHVGGLDDDVQRAGRRSAQLAEDAAAAHAFALAAATEADGLAATLAAADDDADEAALRALQAEATAAGEATLAARRHLAEIEGRLARAARDEQESSERAAAAAVRAGTAATEAASRAAGRDQLTARVTAAEQAGTAAASALQGAEEAAGAARAVQETRRETERAARDARAAASAAGRAALARLDAASGAIERGDGIAPAVRRLRERGAALALDLVEPEPGTEAAVVAALTWRTADAVAAVTADAIALLDDDGLGAVALLCLDRAPARRAPAIGTPLADRVRLLPGAAPGLLDGIHLVDGVADLERVECGIAVTLDGRGIDADRGLVFRGGAGGAALLALRRERDDATTALDTALASEAAAESTFMAAATALSEADAVEAAVRAAVAVAVRAAGEARRAHADAQRDADAAARDAERGAERVAAAQEEAERLGERSAQAGAERVALEAQRSESVELLAALTAVSDEVDARRAGLAERVAGLRAERAALGERVARARADRERHAGTAALAEQRAAANAARVALLEALQNALPAVIESLAACLQRVEQLREPERAELSRLEERATSLAAGLSTGAEAEHALQRQARDLAGSATALEVEAAHVDERLADHVRRRAEVALRAGAEVVDRLEPLAGDEEAALAYRIDRLERRREQLGAVNPLAKDAYDEARERHAETAEQIADLESSIRELRRLIRDLTATITERFDATFVEVERNFAQVIDTLFPGGRGRLRLVEPPAAVLVDDDGVADEPTPAIGPGEPGVELEVSPAGKQITRLAMLSGGEKALAAIAFLFAIMLARPCPFYVLDEVDAALDDTNVERFLSLVDRYREHAQFIVITHQKRTMEAADVLYGVTMANDGISKVVSRRLPRDRREAFDPAVV